MTKALTALGLILLAVLMYFGATIRPRPAGPPGRVRVAYWEKWTGFEADAMRRVVNAFNRRQNRIWVDMLTVSQIDQKMSLATAGGTPPDVAGLWSQSVNVYADRAALMPLDEYLRRAGITQFFLTIPRDLTDAAIVDGCSEFSAFRHIILPLSKPALAVVALFHFLYTWSDFLGPLIYLTDQRMFTLSLGLQFYQSQHGGTEWNLLMAAATIVVLPIIVLFFFTQRTFIQGIAITGLKG